MLESLQSAGNGPQTLASKDQYLLSHFGGLKREPCRSGLVFNGVDQLQALLDIRVSERELLVPVSGLQQGQGVGGESRERLPVDALERNLLLHSILAQDCSVRRVAHPKSGSPLPTPPGSNIAIWLNGI